MRVIAKRVRRLSRQIAARPYSYLLATYLLHAIDGLASPRLPRVLCIMHSPRFFVGDTESESVPAQTHLFIGRAEWMKLCPSNSRALCKRVKQISSHIGS